MSRYYKGFETKQEAKEFYKNQKGAFAISWEKSETEKKASSPAWIRDCKKYFGLDDKFKYVVMYKDEQGW